MPRCRRSGECRSATEKSLISEHIDPDGELTAIVVAYNSEEHIAAMIQTLEASLAAFRADIIVIDNASADATYRVASAALRVGRVVRLDENAGYGQGAQPRPGAGARAIGADPQ